MEIKTFKEYLSTLSKNELDKIINSHNEIYNLFYNKQFKYKKLKKEDLINEFYDFLQNYLESIILNFSLNEYNCLKKIIKESKIKKANMNLNEQIIINIFNNYDLIQKYNEKNKTFYVIYKDIKDIIKLIIEDKENKKYIESWNTKFTILNGIINAYGALEFKTFLDIFKLEYPSVDESLLLNKIQAHVLIKNDFKINISSKNIITIYNKTFTSFSKTKGYVFSKPIKNIMTYEEYWSLGMKDYKYNKEYQKLIKFIKRKYAFNKKDLEIFNKSILNNFIDKYHINENEAKQYIEKNIKEKFEYKNDELEQNLISLFINTAENELKWKK